MSTNGKTNKYILYIYIYHNVKIIFVIIFYGTKMVLTIKAKNLQNKPTDVKKSLEMKTSLKNS